MRNVYVLALIATISMFTTAVMAGPRDCGPGCRPCPPPCRPCGPVWHGYGYGWNCSRDLGNAAAITSIIANGLDIVGNLIVPKVVYPQPVYAVPAPVCVPTVIVGPGCPAVRYGGCIRY